MADIKGPGFQYARNMDGSAYVPSLIYAIAKDSVTFTIGDAVRINTSGYVDICDAGEYVVGVIAQVVDADGYPLTPDSATTHDYTMDSDNTTVDQNLIGFIPALPHYLFWNDADADLSAIDIGQYFDLISSSQVDGDSNHDTTTKTVRLWQYDPDGDADASKGLFNFVESQIYNADCDREA